MRTSRMIRSLPLLPGGHSQFFTTLREILFWLDSAERTTVAEMQNWIQTIYNVKQSTAIIYVRVIGVLDLMRKTRSGEIEITRFGQMLLQANDETIRASMISLLLATYEGFDVTLRLIAEADREITLETIAQRFDEHYPRWQSLSQYRERVLWQRALGLVDAVNSSETYRISELGKAVVLDDSVDSSKGLLPTTSEAKWLSQRLVSASTDGENSRMFEILVSDSFEFLGFESVHLGGRDRTDVLVSVPYTDFRAIIDSKSRSHSLQQLDTETLNEHRKKHDASLAMVIAPAFGGGKVIQRAESNQITLLPVRLLGDVLIYHEAISFSLDELLSLFDTYGLVEQLPEPLIQRRKRQQFIAQLLSDVVELLESMSQAGLGIRWTQQSLHSALVIKSGRSYTPDDVAIAIRLLTHPAVNAIRVAEDHTLQLVMSWQTFTNRLNTFTKLLHEFEG